MRSLRSWLSGCGLVALGWFIGQLAPAIGADPQPGKGLPQPVLPIPDERALAVVNGQTVTRQELGEELIARFGKHQLELLINRRIIHQAALKVGITVTDKEVDDDLRDVMLLGQFRTLAEFEQHFLKKEKNCTLYEYKEDVVRPGIMMKKLAGKRLQVTEEEIKKAFDAKYGDKVQCRIILEKDQKVARGIYEDIIRSEQGVEKAFLEAARVQSNRDLAALGGQCNPVGRNMTYGIVEKRAFELRDGQISEVLQVPGGHVILFREKALPPDTKHTYAEERETLRLEILESKMRAEVPKIFKELKGTAIVQDYLNNKHSNGLIGATEQSSRETAPLKNP